MAEKMAQDEAAKARIISHMNKDHSDSIIRYLEHYGKMPSYLAYDGKMTDVSLNDITLACHGKTYRIPFESHMTSYREARERVVELDKECRKALDHSDVTVRQYLPPTGLYAIEFLVIVATFLAYSRRSWFAEGHIVDNLFGSWFAAFSWSIQPWLFYGMLLLHGAEAVYFARNKLRKHSVNIRSPIWWLFIATCFIEGQFLYKRFDSHVRVQREKEKH